MSQSEKPLPITADDPLLTAFALGELESADSVRYAAAVAASAELQTVVAQIQAEARILATELKLEPTVPVGADQQAEIIAQARRPASNVAPQPKRARGLSRPVTVAAASVLLLPGAWLAYQSLFPKHSSPLMAMREAPAVRYENQPPAASRVLTSADDSSRFHADAAPAGSTRERIHGLNEGIADVSGLERDAEATVRVVTSGPVLAKLDEAKQQQRSRSAVAQSREKENLQQLTSDVEYGETGDYITGVTKGTALNRPAASTPSASLSTAAGAVASTSAAQESQVTRGKFVAGGSGEKRYGFMKPSQPLATKPAMPGLQNPTAARGRDLVSRVGPEHKPGESKPGSEVTLAKSDARKELSDLTVAEVDKLAALALADPWGKKSGLGWAHKDLQWSEDPTSNEAYAPIYENEFVSPIAQPLSTFSIDVDTASYSNLRRFLQGGQLPPPDAVRIEELVNYFAYQYPQPQDGRPFSVQTDIAACPWQPGHQLVRIGLKGKEIPKEQRPPTNLVFLVDVSGSMAPENKLPLVRESLKTLVGQLDERDKIAIVTYAGEAAIRLPSTSVAQRDTILQAISSLGSGGSTNGAAGINTAYDIAAHEFLEKGANRVILCTDGDFNVGVSDDETLIQMIQTRAKGGVFLSIFGFGMGNLKDAKLEQLADKGNGQYGYIDDLQEANKVFIEEMMGTLVTIAKDVKIQIDFNKDAVASYRLVGYENRVMAAEDFHNDKKDAGEIGSGHTVTALYEIVPVKDLAVDDKTRWLTVKLRYKQPEASESVLVENPLTGPAGQLKLASSDFQFASSVAACGMLLRHSQHAGQANWGLVKELAQAGLSHDPHGHRRGYLGLVSQAESLMGQLRPASPPAPESTVGGKYKSLLRKLNAPQDAEKYGQFSDYGFDSTKSYAGAENLPEGYWVYVAPHWYIWAETTATPNKR